MAGVTGNKVGYALARSPTRPRFPGRSDGVKEIPLVLTAAALNVRRIGAWLGEVPRAKTRTAPFVTLLQSTS